MSCLIFGDPSQRLTTERLEQVLIKIQALLSGRVTAAYIFGSTSTQRFGPDSDIDLILIDENAQDPFVHRALEFADLYQVFPKLDVLVYTTQEFERQLADSDFGFWKSVRLSLKQII